MALHSPRPFLVTLGSLAALVGVAGACGKVLSSKETTVVVQKTVPKSKDADVNGTETPPTQSVDARGGAPEESKGAVASTAVQTDPTTTQDAMPTQGDGGVSSGTAMDTATKDTNPMTGMSATATATAGPAATATPVATVASGTIPVFLAMGHYGRTLMSCDGGQSWVADKSDGDSARCFQNDLDCDHGQGSGRGLAASPDGDAYVSFGWGSPSKIKRSRDGVSWTDITPPNMNTTFANLGFADGRLLGGSAPIRFTDDKGATWKTGVDPNLAVSNYRETYSLPHGTSGRILIMGDSGNGTKGGVYSSDKGATWSPMTKPQECVHGQIAYGNGVAVLAGWDGKHCRSTDGGATWTVLPTIAEELKTVVFGDGKFLGYAYGDVWESPNGLAWTKKTRVGGGDLALVAYSPALKAYVGFQQGWGSWYDKQKAYRSTDGITWTPLAAGKFKGGHPINYVIPANVNKSATCPGN